jgi:hypothetical protein
MTGIMAPSASTKSTSASHIRASMKEPVSTTSPATTAPASVTGPGRTVASTLAEVLIVAHMVTASKASAIVKPATSGRHVTLTSTNASQPRASAERATTTSTATAAAAQTIGRGKTAELTRAVALAAAPMARVPGVHARVVTATPVRLVKPLPPHHHHRRVLTSAGTPMGRVRTRATISAAMVVVEFS